MGGKGTCKSKAKTMVQVRESAESGGFQGAWGIPCHHAVDGGGGMGGGWWEGERRGYA